MQSIINKKLECWQLSCQLPTWTSPVLCSFDRGNSMYEPIFPPPYYLVRRSPPLFNRPHQIWWTYRLIITDEHYCSRFSIFSGRELAFTFAICYRRSVCLSLSVDCNVGAHYSVGWNFWQFFSQYDSPGTLVFWCQNSLVGDAPFPLKFSFKVTHPLSNSEISTNIGS